MPISRDAATDAVLSKLLEGNQLTGESRLYREAERSALSATDTPGVYRLAANARSSESVVDVYGPGYVVQAEQVGPGLAFAQTATPNWQETMELRALRSRDDNHPDRVEVEVRVGDLLEQGAIMYPVESVTVERAWYFTLPAGSVDVREVI